MDNKNQFNIDHNKDNNNQLNTGYGMNNNNQTYYGYYNNTGTGVDNSNQMYNGMGAHFYNQSPQAEENRNQMPPAEKSTDMKKTARYFMILPALVLLMALLAVFILGAKQREYDKTLESAAALLEAGDYKAALDSYEDIRDKYPQKAEGYLGTADAISGIAKEKEHLQRYEDAVADYENAIDILSQGQEKVESYFDKKKLREKTNDMESYRDLANYMIEDDYDDSYDNYSYYNNPDRLTNGGDYYEAVAFDPYDYEATYAPWGGVIIVRENGKLGAVDYDGNEIVPTDYDYNGEVFPPTEDGYFVLSRDDIFYLFDAKGNMIFFSENEIRAAKDYFLVIRMLDESMEYATCETEYYHYDGTMVITTVEENYRNLYESKPAAADDQGNLILHEAKDVTQQFDLDTAAEKIKNDFQKNYEEMGETVTNLEISIEYILEEKYGLLSPEGEVTWFDSQSQINMTYVEKKDEIFEDDYIDSVLPYGNYTQETVYTASYDYVGNITNGYGLQKTSGYNVQMNYRLSTLSENAIDGGDLLNKYYLNGSLYSEYVDNYAFSIDFIYKYNSLQKNGSYIANDGTKMVLQTYNDRYLLVDLAQTDENGEPLVIAEHDYLEMSDNEKWLVNADDKWGYADHDGNIIALYQDASAYTGGYAGLIENDFGYIVDEDMNKVAEIGPAYRTWAEGDLIGFTTYTNGTLYYQP